MSACACCADTWCPRGFEPITLSAAFKDVVFDEKVHLNLADPATITNTNLIDNMHYERKFAEDALPSTFASSHTFSVLSADGLLITKQIIEEFEAKHSITSERIPKLYRGGTYRSEFLNDLAHSPMLLGLVSQLAACELIYHPMKIQQLHMNFTPDNESNRGQKVDKWHVDTTPFVLVLFMSDPDAYEGGELQYFAGTKDEGMALLSRAPHRLPHDRVFNVGKQFQGQGVFMQGSRVFHQVTGVTNGARRTSIVFSFQPRNVLALEACMHLDFTYNKIDPLYVLFPDWVRFRAWKVMRRIEMWRESEGTAWAACLDALLRTSAGTEETIAGVEKAGTSATTGCSAALGDCYERMRRIMTSLPYTEERLFLTHVLADAIYPLCDFIGKCEVSGLLFAANEIELEQCLSSPFGWRNLNGAVEDVDNCIEDVRGLQVGSTKMICF